MKTSQEWCDYFESNKQNLLPIPWDRFAYNPSELLSVAPSIREFQKGESSEGHCLMAAARSFAKELGDPQFITATQLFIAEEQRHARELGKFLKLASIPLATRNGTDTAFRFLRRLGGLEIAVGVLVTAELIAQVYYPALKEASSNKILRSICTQIIQDEEQHIHFQTARLALLRQHRSKFYLKFAQWIHHVLFFATLLIVWRNHKTVFKLAKFTFRSYWQSCWHYFERAEKLMDPAAHFSHPETSKMPSYAETSALSKA
jgi:hypothetical protein